MGENEEVDIKVDIVSDVVCPWCIIGYKQFEQALNQCELTASVRWHPFELNPKMAQGGQNLREHIAEKYGSKPEDSAAAREKMTAIGKSLGFEFNYADDMRMYNTFRAHQLMHWAGGSGLLHHLKMELFNAFFTRQLNVDDVEVLADCAEAVGLSRDEALAVLSDGRHVEAVRNHEEFWTSQGVQGVPAMVFNERHLVSGAQGVDNYVSILQQLTQGKAA